MLQSFFNGLAAMTNFSRGLNNVSNNISNMNTPGYRGKDVFFRSVNGQGESDYGVKVNGESTRLYAGDIRQTGNRTDLAINGNGYFVLKDQAGELYYTRAGQFRLNEDNVLIDSTTEHRVMALDGSGALVEFNIDALAKLEPVATTRVNLTGNLSSSGESHEVNQVAVYDEAGNRHTINMNFTNNGDDTWAVIVSDDSDAELAEFVIEFSSGGSPAEGGSSSTQTLQFADSAVELEFNFGEPNSFDGTTQFSSGSSTLSGKAEDGRGAVGLANFEFTERGEISLQYINGEEDLGPTLALAGIRDEASLRNVTGSIYSTPSRADVTYGAASSDQFGLIEGGSVELSNVELTQEFADMLIIQRGYQASARVMSVANELVEQLYSNNR